MTDGELSALLAEVVGAVVRALEGVTDRGPSGLRRGQYHLDVAADEAALAVLEPTGLGVLSEESGDHRPDSELWVALDPVDGSTNAARGLPWYATSACVVDQGGPRVALVANLATGDRYEAVRGGGATRNGEPIGSRPCRRLDQAIVAVAGYPPRHLGWAQFRSLGAAALDLCAVAAGQVDAFVDSSLHAHAPWDYLAGALVCQEAGAPVAELDGAELAVRSWTARRKPVAAASPELLAQLLAQLLA